MTSDPLADLDAIAAQRCRDTLDALIATGASDATVTALVAPNEKANKATRALVKSLLTPAEPEPEPEPPVDPGPRTRIKGCA